MLTLRNVEKTYRLIYPALRGVSLEIGPGEIVGLFGENGAGKTTLMKSILGLVRHRGAVLLDGEPITRRNIERLSFATCEHSFFPHLSPADHRAFYAAHFPRFRDKRFAVLMDFFGLSMHRPAGRMSTGQQNQLEVILALSQGADYILMDEPFAGNDMFNREDFYKMLSGLLEPEETVILSTHLLEEVERFISRGILLREGRIVGDFAMADLEEEGKTLLQAVKESCHYRGDRVAQALERLSGEEEKG